MTKLMKTLHQWRNFNDYNGKKWREEKDNKETVPQLLFTFEITE